MGDGAHTGMDSRIDNLLRLPQFGRHLPDLARLVRGDELFCIFEAGRRGEERPGVISRILMSVWAVFFSLHNPKKHEMNLSFRDETRIDMIGTI